MSAFHSLVRHLWPFPISVPEVDLSERVAIVTGANAGLGYETCLHLVQHNIGTLILAVRNIKKGQDAHARLLEQSPSSKTEFKVWELDLASFDSVVTFGKQAEELEKLDIFIGNAALYPTTKWTTTEDGWEQSLQVNVLSTGLLAHLMLPILARTAEIPKHPFKPHLTLVSSTMHEFAIYDQQDAEKLLPALNERSTYKCSEGNRLGYMYQLHKLLVMQITNELAILPAASRITVNTVDPGLCGSSFMKLEETSPWAQWLFEKFAWSCEYGARGIFAAAVLETSDAAYMQDGKEATPSKWLSTEKGEETQKKLWQELLKLWITKDASIRLIEASAA